MLVKLALFCIGSQFIRINRVESIKITELSQIHQIGEFGDHLVSQQGAAAATKSAQQYASESKNADKKALSQPFVPILASASVRTFSPAFSWRFFGTKSVSIVVTNNDQYYNAQDDEENEKKSILGTIRHLISRPSCSQQVRLKKSDFVGFSRANTDPPQLQLGVWLCAG
jgi:hypothetical protein